MTHKQIIQLTGVLIVAFFIGASFHTPTFIRDFAGRVLSANTEVTPTPTIQIVEAYIEPTDEPIPTDAPIIQKQVIYVYPTAAPTQPTQQAPVVQQQTQQANYGGFPTKGTYCDHKAQETANSQCDKGQAPPEPSPGHVAFYCNWQSTYDSMFNECMRLMQ